MIYCDEGYCPESLLKGRKVKMKINASDFWESPETGLQILGWFPIYAIVLPFRGKGQFKKIQSREPETLNDLLLIHAGDKESHFLPEDNNFFKSKRELVVYLESSVFKSEEEFEDGEAGQEKPKVE